MPQIVPEDLELEGIRVDEVAVVGQRDAVGRIDVERLRFRRGVPARGRVAHVADAHGAVKRQHMAGAEHVPNESAALALMQAFPVPRHDARGILAPVLERGQGVIEILIDR